MDEAGEAVAAAAAIVKSERPKRKAVDGEGSYVKGAIVRVKLRNIQVCSNVEVFPGPGLNLVVGPNGAGKSTIVAGIFLCLGGDHRLLKRHERVGDYVKSKPKQEEEGMIEVELCGGDKANVVVSRRILAGRTIDKKEYRINGKPAKESEVHRLAKSLNIHMENLCQFLPQDRVSEFADMNPQQILRATEEAVGGNDLLRLHDELHKLGLHEREMTGKFEDKQEQEASLLKQRDNLQKPYDRYKHRQEQKKTLELLNKKLAWGRYNKAYDRHNALKAIEAEKKDTLRAAMDAIGPEQAEKDELGSKSKALAKTADNARKEMRTVAQQCDELQKKFSDAEEKFETAVDDKAHSADRVENLKAKITELEGKMSDLDEKIENAAAVDMSAELAKIKAELKELTNKTTSTTRIERSLKVEKEDLLKQVKETSHKLTQLESGKKHVENAVKGADKDVRTAMTWLANNQSKFKEQVLEPIVLHLNVTNQNYAKFLENSIPRRDLLAFVTLNKEDNDTFFAEMKKQNLRVNIVQAPPSDTASAIKNRAGIAGLSKFSVLSDCVDAPDPVMWYLNKYTKLNSILVLEGGDGGEHATKLFQNHNVRKFYYGNHVCSTSQSQYGGRNIFTSHNAVGSPKFLTKSVDQSEVNALKQQLSDLKKQVDRNNSEYKTAKHEDAEARKEATAAKGELEKVRAIHNELLTFKKQRSRMEDKVAQTRSQLNDEESKAKSATGRLKQKATLMLTLALQRKQLVIRITETAKKVFETGLDQAQTDKEFQAVSDSVKDKMSAVKNLEKDYHDAKAERKVVNAEAKKLLEEAQRIIGGYKQPSEVPHLIDAFNMYPNEVSEIEALIAEEKAKLDCTSDTDSDVVAEYESVVEKINSLQSTLDDLRKELEDAVAALEQKKTQWMKEIKVITQTVSEKFGEMFANIGHVGEVSLFEDEHDYSQYGLEIKVSFKEDGKLHQLKGSFQSGGEKMVSTMIFLLALQKLSSCPFRLVDEINQGMDQRNERRVFEQVVHCSEADGQSQYFMVSPKLLPDLGYSESMKVIIIFSGPWIKADEWNVAGKRSIISKALEKKRRILGPMNT